MKGVLSVRLGGGGPECEREGGEGGWLRGRGPGGRQGRRGCRSSWRVQGCHSRGSGVPQ